VLTADRLDQALPQQVGAQVGQRPAAVGQADRRGGLLGQPPDGPLLLVGQASRGAGAAGSADGVQPALPEGVQVGVSGVGVGPHQPGDGAGGQAGGVQQQGLGAAPLPGRQGTLQQAMDVAQLGSTGLTDHQGAGHGHTSIDG
jgi:hypothetical protein